MKKIGIILFSFLILMFITGCGCQRIEKKYDVVFDSNGGSAVLTQSIKEGEMATKPADPKREGYTFAGWYLNDKEYDFSKKISGNITLKAEWNASCTLECSEGFTLDEKLCQCVKDKESDKTFTVTFDSNGGSKVNLQTVKEGETAKKPTNPTKKGYSFNGWLLNGKSYNFNTKIKENITLKASWKENVKTTKEETPVSKIEEETPEPEVEEVITYHTTWVKPSGDDTGREYLRIISSKGEYVAGTVTYVYSNGTSMTESIGAEGTLIDRPLVSSTSCDICS